METTGPRESESEHRFDEIIVTLLGASTTLMAMLPFFLSSGVVIGAARFVVAGFLVFAVLRRSRHPWFKGFVIVVAVLDAAAHWNPFGPDIPAVVFSQYALGFTFLITIAGYLTREVWREAEVGTPLLFMAIGLYCMVGLVWELAFSLLEFSAPGSFRGLCVPDAGALQCGADPHDFPRLHYFSFVTITTLGYGDVVPLTRYAEGLATMAALSGQLFIAILIGRLVGSYMARAGTSK